VEVGLRPRAESPDGETGYDLVALDPAGEPVPGRRVAYEWVREIYDYSWYQQNGEWRFRTTVYDEVVAVGETELDDGGRGRIARQLDNGRYRLDVFDPDSGSAASHRFFAGWWYGPPAPDVPDALELSLEATSLGHGDRLKAFVRAPFAGTAVVTVMNERLRHRLTLDLPPEGAEISVPVDGAWGPGAYLMVTAFRPDAGTPSPLPTRAMGLSWFAIDRDARSLQVAIETPESVLPRQTVELPITVAGAAGGEPIRLTLAAVDEGILQLTNYASPRPDDHFLGQRRLAVDVRDLYGRLIRPAEGRRGRLRSGGDKAALENLQGVSLRTVKTVALYQRDILPDGQGRATVTLDLPDFNGRLRLMAVAYGKTRFGGGDAPLVVRDPLIADLLLPRFLALGDEAQVTLDLHNLSGATQSLDIAVSADGAVAVAGERAFRLSLEADARRTLSLTLDGARVGEGRLGLLVTGGGLAAIERSWDIAVRPAQPYITRREVNYLEPGDRAALTASSFPGVLAETLAANITVTAGTDFNLPELLDSLDRYPYGCTEQTISRALPLLYYGDLAQGAGRERDDQDSQRKVDRSIRRVLERQRSDGSFAVWQSFGSRHPWLTAYAFDFLTRSREAGYDVPPAAYEHTLTWLRNFAERDGGDRYARAYAYYVLARVGQVKAGSLRYFAETHGDQIRTRLGLGHLAAGLAVLGEGERAEAVFEKAIAKRRPKGVHFADYGSDLRDGAAIAALLAEAFPGTTRLHRLATALERAFDRRRYFSTQEEAWLVLATHGLNRGAGTQYRVALNDYSVVAGREALRAKLTAETLQDGYSVENLGDSPLRFITAVRAVPKAPLPAVAEGFSLTRTFYTADGDLTHPEAVTQNDRFVVLIEGRSENQREQQALVVDLLPAGFEIENPALGGEKEKTAFGFLPPLTEPAFTAARDDRFVAALDLRGDERFAVAYLVRAVTPGRFALPGSFVEDMYSPRYHARGAASTITIARP
jgi:uncharacterized protein YfaS (alpha-2-macroglobulin family)